MATEDNSLTELFLKQSGFEDASRTPAFQALLTESELEWGPYLRHDRLPGCFYWRMKAGQVHTAVRRLQEEYRRRGGFLLNLNGGVGDGKGQAYFWWD